MVYGSATMVHPSLTSALFTISWIASFCGTSSLLAIAKVYPRVVPARWRGSTWTSVRDAMLVHLLVDGSDGLLEGTFQELLVVGVAVMMRGCAGPPLRGAVADVLEAAVEEGEHV